MAGHFVSTPVSGFHTVLEPAHFWSQGLLMNGVRSWKLIIKHNLTHGFYGQTLGVRPSVKVPHHFGNGPLWSQGPLVNGVRRWRLNIKPDFTHLSWPDTWCPPQCPLSISLRAQMWNRPTSGARVHL